MDARDLLTKVMRSSPAMGLYTCTAPPHQVTPFSILFPQDPLWGIKQQPTESQRCQSWTKQPCSSWCVRVCHSVLRGVDRDFITQPDGCGLSTPVPAPPAGIPHGTLASCKVPTSNVGVEALAREKQSRPLRQSLGRGSQTSAPDHQSSNAPQRGPNTTLRNSI